MDASLKQHMYEGILPCGDGYRWTSQTRCHRNHKVCPVVAQNCLCIKRHIVRDLAAVTRISLATGFLRGGLATINGVEGGLSSKMEGYGFKILQ